MKRRKTINPLLEDGTPTRGDLYLARHERKMQQQRDRRAAAKAISATAHNPQGFGQDEE